MPQDLFTIRKIATELNNFVTGAKINKVSQPSGDEIDLVLFNKKAFRLVISTQADLCRVSVSYKDKKNPLTAPNFCMLLRKHLIGGEIKGVSTFNDDRIFAIDVLGVNDFYETERYFIYAEIMGKHSNVFLVKNGVILGALKQTPQNLDGARLTLVGAKYLPPTPPDRPCASTENAYDFLSGFSGDVKRKILTTFRDFAPVTAQELEHLINLSPDKNSQSIINEFLNKPLSPVVIDDGIKKDFYAFDYLSVAGKRIHFSTLTDAQEFVLSEKEDLKNLSALKNSVLNPLKNYEKKLLKRYEKTLAQLDSTTDAENLKICGELITCNLYLLKKGMKKAELIYYGNDAPTTYTVALDETLSPQENAKKYFKRYKKLVTAIEFADKQVKELLLELDYVKSLHLAISNVETEEDALDIRRELEMAKIVKAEKSSKKTKNPKPTPPLKYDVCGYTVLVGKNNIQNDALLSSSERYDLWIHVKDYHSAHVIIKTQNKPVPESVILTACEICAFRSDGGNGGKIAVDVAERKHVKKRQGGGLGSVTYASQKTYVVLPNEHKNLIVKTAL